MISLHSCFVAGLTLVYCIWRDRSLFSYDTLEATRDCSQSLTIFGEKWPGAVKYRDIFDALSGNLLKTIVNPAPTVSPRNKERHDSTTEQPANQRHDMHGRQSLEQPPPELMQTEQASMGHMVSESVKEAFMEVDGEAPGGWQGWRMWDEMVGGDLSLASDPSARSRGDGYGQDCFGTEGFDSLGLYGVDPVQDATMGMGNFATMDDIHWNMNTSR